MEKTSTGLSENVAGLLCYVLGWISGIVFILIEQENKFVRFHAMQSIATFGAITIIIIVLSILVRISPNFTADWFLDGRRRKPKGDFIIPEDTRPTVAPMAAPQGEGEESPV